MTEMPSSRWRTAVDAATGRTYYYHADTGQTRWTIPEVQPSQRHQVPDWLRDDEHRGVEESTPLSVDANHRRQRRSSSRSRTLQPNDPQERRRPSLQPPEQQTPRDTSYQQGGQPSQQIMTSRPSWLEEDASQGSSPPSTSSRQPPRSSTTSPASWADENPAATPARRQQQWWVDPSTISRNEVVGTPTRTTSAAKGSRTPETFADDSDEDNPHASPKKAAAAATTTPERRRRRCTWILGAVLCCLLVAALILIPLVLITRKNSSSSSLQPSDGDYDFGPEDFDVTTTPVDSTDVLDCNNLSADLVYLELQDNAATALLLKYSTLDHLCMLVRTDGNTTWMPVARTYAGRPWEAYMVGGGAAASTLGIECPNDQTHCAVSLTQAASSQQPFTNGVESTLRWALASRSYVLSDRDTLARFLEQTTFGTTRKELNALESTLQKRKRRLQHEQQLDRQTEATSNNALTSVMAEWIRDQMNTVKPSLHRVFWRRHAVSRFEASSPTGLVTHPCQMGAAYRKYAFVDKHKYQWLQITTINGSQQKLLLVDNVVLTVVTGSIHLHDHGQDPHIEFADGSYKFCKRPEGFIGGKVWLQHPQDGRDCKRTVQFGPYAGNPPVHFTELALQSSSVHMLKVDLPDTAVQPIDTELHANSIPQVQRVVTTQELTGELCETLEYTPPGGPVPIVFGRWNGGSSDYWIHDPRFVLQDNTLARPLIDGGGAIMEQTANDGNPEYATQCANVPRTFQNLDSCFLSRHPQACGHSQLDQSLDVELNENMLQTFYALTNGVAGQQDKTRYVYAVDGLRIEDDEDAPAPCLPMARSRWIADASCSTGNLQVGAKTNEILTYLLSNFGDTVGTGPFTIRDISFPARSSTVCDATDVQRKGMRLRLADGTCWRNVHPDLYQVYDMTVWLSLHPGGSQAISQWAERGSAFISFPSHHEMWRWRDNKQRFFNVGRFGQTVDFSDLSPELQASPQVVTHLFDSTTSAVSASGGRGLVVCGSPGEVANDLSLGGESFRGAFDIYTPLNNTSGKAREDREMVWAQLAFAGTDQLRQRMAWALSQILVINIGANTAAQNEAFVNYYDIFVRHAFGSYDRVLKEVAHSYLMASMLTYRELKSTGYSWRKNVGVLEHPDENFAREIMQLFTIGLYELEEDGTQKLTSGGEPIRSYSNDDVMEYARVWTGFRKHAARGNKDDAIDNRVDPMYIHIEWRDVFPKLGLDNQYIGDGYPLCADLPKQHFLKRGAEYRLLGFSSLPELRREDPRWASDPAAERLIAAPNGALNAALCGSQVGPCTYPAVVTLPGDIPCSSSKECSIDTVRTVQVEGGVFYEYVRPPCVYQAFLEDARTIKTRYRGDSGMAYQCADPRTEVASTSCCFDDGNAANRVEEYWGERVKASTAETRCAHQEDSSLAMCTATGRLVLRNCEGFVCWGPYFPFYWMAKHSSTCLIKAKIDGNTGRMAVVHSVPDEDASGERKVLGLQDEDNKTFFRVHYLGNSRDGIAGLVADCVSNPFCSFAEDGFCMCQMIATNEQVFSSAPTRQEVLSSLTIGAFPPELSGQQFTTSDVADVKVHTDTTGRYSKDTIFEVTDDFGRVQLRKNMRSVVRIANTDIAFRNPVHFISLSEPTQRDANYETDAALDHYIFHKNTAPFMSIRLAQRFGISNPSPRYIETMAKAFRTGTYTNGNLSFGSGAHGDLGAALAAALLDDEARNVLLDRDPTHGALKEPLIKVMGVLRNLEFQTTPEYPFPRFLPDTDQTIGQMVYKAQSIFSFFLPEFQPNGMVANSGLVSPEALAHSSPNIIGTMNGIISMIKYGLDRCYGGLGFSRNWINTARCRYRVPGVFVNASAFPTFVPSDSSTSAKVVDELATIMTSGRLSSQHRELVADVLRDETNLNDGVIKIQQLIASSSEFHSTGTVSKSGKLRLEQKEVVATSRPYKALVVVVLNGGCDSYNLIVPHSCSGRNAAGMTVLQQYQAERGEIGLAMGERTAPISAQGQPCEQFAIHQQLPVVRDLYEQNDLAFFLNAGVINKAATKENYESQTTTQLFAHNACVQEMQRVDPYHQVARSGILGRLVDVLNSEEYGYNAQTIAIDDAFPAVNSDKADSTPPIILNSNGPEKFDPAPAEDGFDLSGHVAELNDGNHISSSVFGDTWSDLLMRSLEESEFLSEMLDNVTLSETCESNTFDMAMQLIQTREERGSDRDLIILKMKGYDTHSEMKENLEELFGELNVALECFVANIQGMGLWNDVTLTTVSEFGRTLTPNTNLGSDHGWAGHYFTMGGAVNGGKLFGEYPNDITDESPVNIGRGRLLPTLSWESIWTSMIEWLDVKEKDFGLVLPNAAQTNTTLLRRAEVFVG